MEVVSYFEVALVSRLETEKKAACRFYTALAGFFWAVFQRLALTAVDLDSGLLLMLRRVRWQCWSAKRQPGLAIRSSASLRLSMNLFASLL